MAVPSVTYTFVNDTSADATAVNQNFTDIINGISDGTKDLSISALTCAGAVVMNGAVTLGNAAGDAITITGALTANAAVSLNNAVTINEAGADVDFRVEGDTDQNLLLCDAGLDQIGIGVAPTNNVKLDIASSDNTAGSSGLRAEASGTGTNNYGAILKATGAGTTNYGCFIDSSGATNNWGLYANSGDNYMSGKLGVGGSTAATQLAVTGEGFFSGGIYIDTIATSLHIDDQSDGASSSGIYIGNAQIQVSSDARLKKLRGKSEFKAVEAICKTLIQDFTWDDPSDKCYNNRNARGVWTGPTAQDLIKNIPFMVNAPRKEDTLEIDHESDSTWMLDNGAAIGVFMKAIQEQQAQIEALTARIEVLEA